MLLLFICAVLISHTFATQHTLTVEVPAGNLQCFFQTIDNVKHKFIEVDYQVIDGGDLNINFMAVFGAEVLAQDVLKQEGNHKIPLKYMGDYQICFDNTFSYQSRKVVFFEIYLLDDNQDMSDEDFEKMSNNNLNFEKNLDTLGITIDQIRNSFEKLKHSFNSMEYNQAILRAYESRDRAIMGANLNRVNLWSTINTIVIVLVGCLQVFMIKSLFNENSKIGRLLRRT